MQYYALFFVFMCLLIIGCQKSQVSGSMYNLHAYINTSELITASVSKTVVENDRWQTRPCFPQKIVLFENSIQVASFTSVSFSSYECNYKAKPNENYKVLAVFNSADSVYGEVTVPEQVVCENSDYNIEYNVIDVFNPDMIDDSTSLQDTVCTINAQLTYNDFKLNENVYQLTVRRLERSKNEYNIIGEENALLDIQEYKSVPYLDFERRKRVNPNYYTVSDEDHDGEKVELNFSIEDSEIDKFPVHYVLSFVNLEYYTHLYYNDLENRSEDYSRLNWDMGFKLDGYWSFDHLPGFVPCSMGNNIVNGVGFIAASAGFTDTIIVEGPQ